MPQHNAEDDEHRNPMPDFGKISLIRTRSKSIDDTLFAKEDFCRLELLGGQPMHFFAVFDAHGDPHVCHHYHSSSFYCNVIPKSKVPDSV